MTQAGGNNVESTPIVGRPFPKGVSGNPSGRPKGTVGLAAYIKAKTTDGQEIADFMMCVMRGEKIEGKSPKIVERIEAARWLADRAWGRAIQQQDINVNHGIGHSLESASMEQLDFILSATPEQLETFMDARASDGARLSIEGEFEELVETTA
jgi:hypothetical protein